MRSLDRKTHDDALNRFYETLKDDEIIQTLNHSADPRIVQLLDFMFQPQYARFTFTRLCRECALSLGDIVDAFRRYQLDRGIVAMARQAPAIMHDTAQDARSGEAICNLCQGAGLVENLQGEEGPCIVCKGVGSFRVPGHEKSRELFFKTMGLIGKTGPLIAQQFNIGDSKAPRVEDFVSGLQKALKE